MDPLRIVAAILILCGLMCVGLGAGYVWHGAEVSDNRCDNVDECSGRDRRADKFTDGGEMLLMGGFGLTIAAGVLFAVPSLRRV